MPNENIQDPLEYGTDEYYEQSGNTRKEGPNRKKRNDALCRLLEEKKFSSKKDLEWVYGNIGARADQIDWASAPSAGAIRFLEVSKTDKESQAEFYRTWKAPLAKMTSEGGEGDELGDGGDATRLVRLLQTASKTANEG